MVAAWWLEDQQQKEQPFSRFTDVFDVYAFNYPRCDLLTLLPFSDRSKLAGWESARRRPVTFIFSRLFGSPAKVIKETRAVHSGLPCINVRSQNCLLRVVVVGLKGGNERMRREKTRHRIFVALLSIPPVWPSPLKSMWQAFELAESGMVIGSWVSRPAVCLWASYSSRPILEEGLSWEGSWVIYIFFLLFCTGTLSLSHL